MKLTRDQVELSKTAKGGFTRKQLEAWGISWPPPRGWRFELETGRKYLTETERLEYIEMLSMRKLYEEKSPTAQ
jgi:hypothetical protein